MSFTSMHNDYLDPDRHLWPEEEPEPEEPPKMNTAAQELGRLGRGKKKTLSKEAIRQRRKAARISGKKRKGKKTGPRGKSAPDEIVVESVVPVAVEPEIDDTVRSCPECGRPYENDGPCSYCHPAPAQTPQNGDAPAGDESVPVAEKKVENSPLTEPIPSVDSDFEARKHLLA